MRTILLFALLCVATVATAQSGATRQAVAVRPVEFELHFGAALPLDHIPASNASGGPVLGMELRYNFKNSPMDVGIALDFTSLYYEFESVPDELEQNNHTTTIGFTTDYNFGQGRNVNPFVGIGLGLGVHDALLDVVDGTNDCNNTVEFSPRIGVELWRHLRLTLSGNIACKYYNGVALTVGCVLGGGKKKSN